MPHQIDPATGRQRRGFAGMDPEKRRAIAAKGGASRPGRERSFAKEPGLAARAGRAGGRKSKRAPRCAATSEDA